ncbi:MULTISPECIES: TniQ family protein [Streptomyces]|uniref:TniQ family protein n=1 Tax=Streptomyces TaxID=1883 RepID=UPI000D11DA9A|nr:MULTISPECIES: TniQ family protein [Streptomyces]
MSGYPSDILKPLPIRVRPKPAETIDSFIRRLAQANHIKPSRLYNLLTWESISTSRPEIDQLATLSRVDPEILGRTLVNALSLLTYVKPSPKLSDTENTERQKFFEIQRDAQNRGLTVRALATRHDVSRRTVRRALGSPRPQPHELARRQVRVIEPIRHLIVPLLEQNINISDIWTRLVDEHGIALRWMALYRFAQTWRLDQNRDSPNPGTYPHRPPHRANEIMNQDAAVPAIQLTHRNRP